jgi:hypothetical protein
MPLLNWFLAGLPLSSTVRHFVNISATLTVFRSKWPTVTLGWQTNLASLPVVQMAILHRSVLINATRLRGGRLAPDFTVPVSFAK